MAAKAKAIYNGIMFKKRGLSRVTKWNDWLDY